MYIVTRLTLLKKHPHSRPVFKGVYARNRLPRLLNVPSALVEIRIQTIEWDNTGSLFIFFHNTCLTSNNTTFCTMSVASTGFSKSLVTSVMLCRRQLKRGILRPQRKTILFKGLRELYEQTLYELNLQHH
jgi:hypothetical protein